MVILCLVRITGAIGGADYMTTHFSNGVTNVRGKDGDTSLFSGIKQPLITGGYGQEVAYQNDWVIYQFRKIGM